MVSTSLVQGIASAITTMENSNPSLNNPGNIMDLAYYNQTGKFQLQQYPTVEAGQAALDSLVSSYIDRGYNLNQFFATYAPTGHGANDPTAYASYVADKIGVDPNVPLTSVGEVGSVPSVTSSITYPQGTSTPSISSPTTVDTTDGVEDLASLLGSGSDDPLSVSSDIAGGGISTITNNTGLLVMAGVIGLVGLLYFTHNG